MKRANTNVDLEITVKFKIQNVIDEDALQEVYEGSLFECAKDMIEDNGICGVIDGNGTLIKVERA